MKKNKQEFDEFDKLIFNYYQTNREIPESTKNAIHNAFDKPSKQKKYLPFSKVATIIFAILLISTTTVFAKDIINFVKNIFSNTTPGINKAIENGYIQNVDMDFVYDNDIGIKIDYLVMDDTNLDISYVYDIKNKENIESISLNEYIIRDENNNLIYYYIDNKNLYNDILPLANLSNRTINFNNIFQESILYNSNKFPESTKLIIEIHSISITQSNHTNYISGNWIININLENPLLSRNSETYINTYNQYINNLSSSLTETSLDIKIQLNKQLDNDILLQPENIKLSNQLNEYFEYKNIRFKNYETGSEIDLKFNIGKYNTNIDKLNLYIKFNTNNFIDINLQKY